MKTSKNICLECGAKCCKAGEIVITREYHKKIIEAGFRDFFKERGDFFYIVNHKKACPYLKDNLCSIYNVRPLTCKCWPVFPLYDGKIVLMNCPLAKSLSKKDVDELKKIALKIPKDVIKLMLDLDRKNKGRNPYDEEFGWDLK